jgi:hypothetical protein
VYPQFPDLITRSALVLDLERFVPTQLQGLNANEKTKKNKADLVRKESIEWTEIDHIYLPKAVYGESRSSMKINERRVTYPIQYEHHFDWRSVNKGIDPSLRLSHKLLFDVEKLLEMVSIDESETKEISDATKATQDSPQTISLPKLNQD